MQAFITRYSIGKEFGVTNLGLNLYNLDVSAKKTSTFVTDQQFLEIIYKQ